MLASLLLLNLCLLHLGPDAFELLQNFLGVVSVLLDRCNRLLHRGQVSSLVLNRVPDLLHTLYVLVIVVAEGLGLVRILILDQRTVENVKLEHFRAEHFLLRDCRRHSHQKQL